MCKIQQAKKMCVLGRDCPSTFDSFVSDIPKAVIEDLSARTLADLMDHLLQVCNVGED